ncbi:MAG: hypothetical protein KDA75_11140, partial [Planctomycetaceae bacterium]|nr:hypothetical protein [Planctomycetaceae bacterium]
MKAAKQALKHIAERRGTVDPAGYVARPEDNLIHGVCLREFEGDYLTGAGNELRTKFCAVHSSAALVANTFGPFRLRPDRVCIDGLGGFSTLQFEWQCPTGLRGTPPNLDVRIESGQNL